MENKEKKMMIDKLAQICAACGQVLLSPACGKYAGIMDSEGGAVIVRVYSKRGADQFKNLSRLPASVVKTIYDDVVIDFD